jgi:hypothetical protein
MRNDLPELSSDAWARALPGREAAAQNEVLRLFWEATPGATPASGHLHLQGAQLIEAHRPHSIH